MVLKIVMLVLFFGVMVGVGIYCRKNATDVNGFVLGGRSVGPWLTAFAYGTSYFSAVIFIGYAGQFGWIDMVSISATTEHPREAYEVAKFLTWGKEGWLERANQYGVLTNEAGDKLYRLPGSLHMIQDDDVNAALAPLFPDLGYWNDWWNALMFINDRDKFPLQYFLYNILSNVNAISSGRVPAGAAANIKLPSETVKMAVTMITIGPIIFLYPFIQKYFVDGIMTGAVKE